MTNEFEEQYNADDFNDDDIVGTEQQQTTSESESEMVTEETQEFDFNKASKSTKGPERENLDGKTVVISDAKIILPKEETEWNLSRNKKCKYKQCKFIMFYDNEGQREYYSGIKMFERMVDGKSKLSEPNIQNDGKTQATMLKQVYAKYKGKKTEEVSMHEFLSFLKSKPKARLESKPFEYDEKITNKNTVVEFVN